MRRRCKVIIPNVLAAAILLITFFGPSGTSYGLDITIEVAPRTLNLQNSGEVVTVHTNIVYSNVVATTVSLNDIEIASWKADNRGNFVAKFLMEEVKALAEIGSLTVPGENELTLVGFTTEDEKFTGTQTITVIDVSGRRLK